MKNKRYLQLLLITLSMAASSFSFAGDRGGNGGGGHFCPNGMTEVYDLQEGRFRYKLPILQLTGTRDEVMELGLQKIKEDSPFFESILRREIVRVKEKMEFLSLKIERTLDADNLYVNENCEYLQIANWDTTVDRLIVSSSRWAELPEAQKGVLIFHEAAYSLYRSKQVGLQVETNDESVDLVRKFVAQVFSSGPVTVRLVKSQFMAGGISTVPTKIKSHHLYKPTSPIVDIELIENPYCQSDKYTLMLSNQDKYHLIPGFGESAGKLVKVGRRQTLSFKHLSLPIKFSLEDMTRLVRMSFGELDNFYDPRTQAEVEVRVIREGCDETFQFSAQCGILAPQGFTKKARCAETTISKFEGASY